MCMINIDVCISSSIAMSTVEANIFSNKPYIAPPPPPPPQERAKTDRHF